MAPSSSPTTTAVLPLPLEALDGGDQRRVLGVRAEEVRPADEVQAAVHLGAHAATGDGAEALDTSAGARTAWLVPRAA